MNHLLGVPIVLHVLLHFLDGLLGAFSVCYVPNLINSQTVLDG